MDEPATGITGPQLRRRPVLLLACALLVILGIVFGIRGRDWFFLVMYGAAGSFQVVLSWRPPTQVTVDGIRRPWRRPGFVPWSEVSAVLAPQLGVTGIRLQLGSGRTVALDIPADRCAAVAAMGGKDVIRPVLPTVRPGPPPPRTRTDQDVLVEVTRQAATLARQREDLARLSRRLAP